MFDVFNYGGNSGLSGIPGVVAQAYDTDLVEVVRERKSRRRSIDMNVVCPMVGKFFCLSDWKKSISRLPLDRSHVLVHDNSNNSKFGDRLQSYCKKTFDSYTLVQDRNPHIPAHLQHDCPSLSARCDAFYGHIYENLINPKLPLCLNLEDDVVIPEDSFRKLSHVIQDEGIGTVIGQCNDRRDFVYRGHKSSISVDFQVNARIGVRPELQVSVIHIPEKERGVDCIGAGHMGLWLTKTEAIRRIGVGRRQYGGLNGTDINWGFALNSAGLNFAIDWSIKMRHMFKDSRGRKQSC